MQLNDKKNCTYWRKFQMWTLNPCGHAATDYTHCTCSVIIYQKANCLIFISKFPFFPPTGSQGLVLLTTDSHLMKRSAINDEMMRGHHMSAWPFPLQRCSKVNSCKKVDIPQRVLPSQTLCYLQHKCQLSNRECFACVFLTDYYLHNWQAASLHSAGVCLFV